MSSGNPTETSRDPDLTGAEAAMHRAAQDARRRAEHIAKPAAAEHIEETSGRMKDVFADCGVAYKIDEGKPPTIVPAVTEAEGHTVIELLKTLREAGLRGSTEHLRNACDCINKGEWAGSIRESIHTVESVARMLAPEAKTLKQALAATKDHGGLHPALKDGFIKLYGYTSDEQGVRHPLLDNDKAQVGMDEAVFMLGACASFASYLWRKHAAGEAS